VVAFSNRKSGSTFPENAPGIILKAEGLGKLPTPEAGGKCGQARPDVRPGYFFREKA
jgi:hypothetical protein